MGVLSGDAMGNPTVIVALRVFMNRLRNGSVHPECCSLGMVIPWEDLRESVSHFQFTIACCHEHLVCIDTPVLQSVACNWRQTVILAVCWQQSLIG